MQGRISIVSSYLVGADPFNRRRNYCRVVCAIAASQKLGGLYIQHPFSSKESDILNRRVSHRLKWNTWGNNTITVFINSLRRNDKAHSILCRKKENISANKNSLHGLFFSFFNNIEWISKNMEKIQVFLCTTFELPVMTTTKSIQSRLTNILICELFTFSPI